MRNVFGKGFFYLLVTMFLVHIPVFGTCAGVNSDLAAQPVLIGLTAEYGLKNSTSAQGVEMGIRVAIDAINARGGVLGGRPLALEIRDDRSVPGRAIDNVYEFIATKDLVAVFGARFSPVMLELIPVVQKEGIVLLDPWASADGITAHQYKPSYTFRLSLKDSDAMPVILGHARKRGLHRVGFLLPNTGWGRSNEQAAQTYLASHPDLKMVRTRWYNWGDASYLEQYRDILAAGADVLVLVANDTEGSTLINEIASLPENEHLPILSHWGVTGGRFFENTRANLFKLDLSVVQSFSFFKAPPAIRERFMEEARNRYHLTSWETIDSPVGVGHAYDLTHILAMAINKAGSTDRQAIRAALESVGPYSGLTGSFDHPFTPVDHDALGPESVFLAKYREDGVIVPIQ